MRLYSGACLPDMRTLFKTFFSHITYITYIQYYLFKKSYCFYQYCIRLCEVDQCRDVFLEGHIIEMGNRWGAGKENEEGEG
jgi:hypothetical protein